ncbi:inositol monophosphatase family protein [Dawidia soli]|uniref:Inositol monophosphatase family protein n=1 Tax=Dawidia soli TaxID=2782352 RepID=A0AAP2D5M2_9BACT|nr:inositol monophosphatase family protein [Dawidia soli]MBT1684971.1 inositol monophosphatase family protein [Dawidia soli]
MQQELDYGLLTRAIREVGQTFLADFRKTAIPQTMDDLLTAVRNIEDTCFEALQRRIDLYYPSIPWVDDDEFTADTQRRPAEHDEYWLCDTMDGAIQYLQHIPGWTINVVLVRKGRPYFSVVYDALTDELFWAVDGQGAYLYDRKLRTSTKTVGDNMLAVWEYGHQLKMHPGWRDKTADAVTGLLDCFGIVRNYGPHGLQLAYLGAGRIDLFLQDDLDTHNWLAGMLIAREAGAQVLSVDAAHWQWGDEGLLAGTANAVKLFLQTYKK